ncbi:MAG: HDOD domain-containing protein [Desulfobacterales bacterium]|nr:HDOD domain-containing protein [Desulfobacterales bacterium]
MSDKPIIETILASVASFEGMPGNAAKVLAMLDDPEFEVSQIEETLRLDPELTANVLRLTNSAYFGLSEKIGSLKQAIVVLGSKKLIQLVMATCMSGLMSQQVEGYDLDKGDLWRHSIAVSVVAEKLIEEIGIAPEPEIFTAALLHDIGKLLLGQHIHDYQAAIDARVTEEKSFQLIERDVLGADHAEIGARILQNWSFPENIISAVRWHHEPDLAPEVSVMTDAVHAANVLCQMIGIGSGREGLHYEPAPGTVKRLGLKAILLERLASQALMWIEELNDILAVKE